MPRPSWMWHETAGPTPQNASKRRNTLVTSKMFELLLSTATEAEVVDTHDHLRPASDFGTPMTVTNLLLHTYVAKCIRPPDGSANGIGDRYEDVMPVDYPNFAEIA